jgi:hypothetical protein
MCTDMLLGLCPKIGMKGKQVLINTFSQLIILSDIWAALEKITGFVSDGAPAMTGKNNKVLQQN